MSSPLSTLQWVDRDMVKPNDYNPNKVSKQNLELLKQSILTNGWTLPIVVRPDFTIIDGFHRWTVAGEEPLKSMLEGKVPVVIVEHKDKAGNIYGKGIINSIAIDANGEDYDYKTVTFSGVKDIIDATCNMLSAVTNIPQTRTNFQCR